MEADVLQPSVFTPLQRWLHWSWSRPGAWVSCGSQVEAAAPASGRRSGSCHHDLRHPWPLAHRHDSICGSAASRSEIRHRRPWPRVDQVALGIKRRWHERGTWPARVGVSSIASRYSLGFVEHLCLATAASAECRVVLGSKVTTHSNDLKAINSRKQIFGRAATRLNKRFPVEVKTHKLESYLYRLVFFHERFRGLDSWIERRAVERRVGD